VLEEREERTQILGGAPTERLGLPLDSQTIN
jgi:hypothetical protein